LGVSRERVRQIETRAFEKVRRRVTEALGAAQALTSTPVAARQQTVWH
jgi:DNA-directed RNA polymerase sigma subunit (sigma70/sigma32)